MLENGSEICNCIKKKCERHGNCQACIEYHSRSKSLPLPYCKREKKKPHNGLLSRKSPV